MKKLQIDFMHGNRDANGVWTFSPNSAGGMGVRMSFKNLSDKTIKYAKFCFIAKNPVNDAVNCSITNSPFSEVQFTGPVGPNQQVNWVYFQNLWYNPTISSVNLFSVELEYMDGVKEKIPYQEYEICKLKSSSGCYVATAVYGSYDCPQVWTLRRYRDNTLATTWYGRALIHTYYAISPTIVKWFGETKWFKSLWQRRLDRMVAKLQENGVESTPYQDKEW